MTFGLGIILVNAMALYLLDIILTDMCDNWTNDPIYATLIISLINILISFLGKKSSKE